MCVSEVLFCHVTVCQSHFHSFVFIRHFCCGCHLSWAVFQTCFIVFVIKMLTYIISCVYNLFTNYFRSFAVLPFQALLNSITIFQTDGKPKEEPAPGRGRGLRRTFVIYHTCVIRIYNDTVHMLILKLQTNNLNW